MGIERDERLKAVLHNRQPDLTIVLENVHDPHNIFAVMRTCDSVGVQELYVLNTDITLHQTFGKKSSSGAKKWLNVYQFHTVEECMVAVKKKYDKIYATHLGTESQSLYELNLTERVALVFGNEREGVSEELLKHCNGNFIVPQVGMSMSLNVSVACAVSLYEAFRQRSVAGYYNGISRMEAGALKAMEERWEVLASSEYRNKTKRGRASDDFED